MEPPQTTVEFFDTQVSIPVCKPRNHKKENHLQENNWRFGQKVSTVDYFVILILIVGYFHSTRSNFFKGEEKKKERKKLFFFMFVYNLNYLHDKNIYHSSDIFTVQSKLLKKKCVWGKKTTRSRSNGKENKSMWENHRLFEQKVSRINNFFVGYFHSLRDLNVRS